MICMARFSKFGFSENLSDPSHFWKKNFINNLRSGTFQKSFKLYHMIFQMFISQNHHAVMNWNFQDFHISLIKNKWWNHQVMRWFPENVFWYYSSWYYSNFWKSWKINFEKNLCKVCFFLLRELVLGLIMLKYFKICFIVRNVCFFCWKKCKFAKLTAEKSFFYLPKNTSENTC